MPSTVNADTQVHVAAAVITNLQGEVLISRRPPEVHQGGLWEFPGGKLEPGETPEQALERELHEELGIRPEVCRPLIRIHHDYSDKAVLLDVWQVDQFSGEAHGREGQPIAWVKSADLPTYEFPDANCPIVTAARLPDCYAITPEVDDPESFLAALEKTFVSGIRLVQFRSKTLDADTYQRLAKAVVELAAGYQAEVLLNATPEVVVELGAAGVQLNSNRLMALKDRPLDSSYWVVASCHNAAEIEHACRIGVDFVVLSPVQATQSHPDANPLGWQAFQALTEAASLPVYALGGMNRELLTEAWRYGAQGVSAIRALWREPEQG